MSEGAQRAARGRAIAFVAAYAAAGCAATSGCAAPAKTAAPPTYPRSEGTTEDSDVRRPTTGVAPQGAPRPAGATQAPPPIGAASELRAAELELAAASDCATACRALRSMERAASHLCAVGATDEDRRACDDARARVAAAQDRVQRTCGGCGP